MESFKHVALFELEKETKGAVRYKEVILEGGSSVLGTVYVRKSYFAGGAYPSYTKITFEQVDAGTKV